MKNGEVYMEEVREKWVEALGNDGSGRERNILKEG